MAAIPSFPHSGGSAMAEIKQSNPNCFADLDLKLKQLDGFSSKVGWFDSAKYEESGTSIAYVASIQEFGAPGKSIPPRPFMRPAQIKNEQKWRDTAAFAAKKVLDGSYSGRDAMDLLGETAQGDIIKAIEDVMSPPLSMVTLLARKARRAGQKVTGKTIGMFYKQLSKGPPDVSGVSTKPLIDSGDLIAHVTNLTESSR